MSSKKRQVKKVTKAFLNRIQNPVFLAKLRQELIERQEKEGPGLKDGWWDWRANF